MCFKSHYGKNGPAVHASHTAAVAHEAQQDCGAL